MSGAPAAEVIVGDLTYRAIPVPCPLFPVPGPLRSWAVWAVTEDDGRTRQLVGWIADDPGWSSWPEGAGQYAMFIGGTRPMPRLSYVSNCASAREGARLAGQACVWLRYDQARRQSAAWHREAEEPAYAELPAAAPRGRRRRAWWRRGT